MTFIRGQKKQSEAKEELKRKRTNTHARAHAHTLTNAIVNAAALQGTVTTCWDATQSFRFSRLCSGARMFSAAASSLSCC